MSLELSEQQIDAKKHLENWRVGALFMQAGTGKTRVACEIVNSARDVDFVLYVAPLGIIKKRDGISNVEDEVNKWGGFKVPTMYIGVETIQASDVKYLDARNKLLEYKNPFIIVDESIKIKNIDAKRTKRIIELGGHAKYKLILNGTPITRNLLDIWAQMEFLSHDILNMSFAQFKNTFCKYKKITKKFPSGWSFSKDIIIGYENVDYLYSLIRSYVYECDLQLNIKQNYNTIYYSIDEHLKERYYELKERYLDDDVMMWMNNNIFLEMTQKMQHTYCCTQDKFDVLDCLFREIDESKTIIFCKYVDSRKACEGRYKKAKVLSYQKESFGLNLQQYCNTIYFDKIWDLALRIQSSRRTYRTGQEYDCRYWDLTGDVGLEKLIDSNIEKKVGMTEYFKSKARGDFKKDL